MNPKRRRIGWRVNEAISMYPELCRREAELHTPSMAPPEGPAVSGGGPGRPVESTAIRTLPPREQTMLDAVREALRICSYIGNGDAKMIISAMYWEGGTRRALQVSEMVHCSYSQVVMCKNNFFAILASLLDETEDKS